MIFLDLGLNIGISVLALVLIVYGFTVHFSLSSVLKFKKYLSSAEISVKMAAAETITLIKNLSIFSSLSLTEEDEEIIEEIETKIITGNIFGIYRKANLLYISKFNEAISVIKDEKIKEKLLNSKILQNEIDCLYQKALFSYNNNLLGYNYWVKFIPTRIFTKLLKLNKKEELY